MSIATSNSARGGHNESDASTSVTTRSQDHVPFIVLQERIDVAAGERLINSVPMLALKCNGRAHEWRGYSNLVGAAKQLGGMVPVSYYLTSDYGRFKCRVLVDGHGHLPSYMNMMREVRAHLAGDAYLDVDFVNSSPTILMQAFDERRIPSPLLTRYVTSRDECIAEVVEMGSSRDAAKELFIRLMFFGSVGSWLADNMDSRVPAWVHDLQHELQQNAGTFLSHREHAPMWAHHAQTHAAHEGGPLGGNERGQMMALFLQTCERKCLEALLDAVRRDGYEVGALIHDGMHVGRGDGLDAITDDTLACWERHVARQTGYEMKLAVKPFDRNPAWLADVTTDLVGDDDVGEHTATLPYADLKALWERRTCKIVQHGVFVRDEKNGQRVIYARRGLLDAYEHLCYSTITKGHGDTVNVKRVRFLLGAAQCWLHDNDMRQLNTMNLFPPPLACPPDTYNLWDGFEVAKYRPTVPIDMDSPGVRAFVGHVSIMLGDNMPCIKYALDWIAQIFQQPGVKPGIALLLRGEEGVGKNRLTDLIKLMLGEDKFLETSRPADVLYGRFTEARRGKFCILINEANSFDSLQNADILKDMITGTRFVCEAKGRDSTQANCFDRFIFATNRDNVVRINNSSRRFVAFDIAATVKGNTKYFKELSAHIDDPHARHEFYHFLMGRNISDIDWINDRPATSSYTDMLQMNLDKEVLFLRDGELLPAYRRGVPLVRYVSSDLFDHFKMWLQAGNYKYDINENRFGRKLSKMATEGGEHLAGCSKQRSHRGTVYLFQVDEACADMVLKKWVAPEEVYRSAGLVPMPEEHDDLETPPRTCRE